MNNDFLVDQKNLNEKIVLFETKLGKDENFLDFQEFKSEKAGLFINVYEDNEISMSLDCTKAESIEKTTGVFSILNKNPEKIQEFKLFCAAQKHISVQVFPPTSTNALFGEKISEKILLTNSLQGQRGIVLKLKIEYKLGTLNKSKLVTVDSIPSNY